MAESPLTSIAKRLEAVYQTSDRIVSQLLPFASDVALSNACARIHWNLKRNATIAVNRIKEFSGYLPLRERFLENISNPDHIQVIGTGGIEVFDENVAGTHADLMEGWIAGGKSEGPKWKRLLAWKYGFYMPEREGKGKIGKISYTDIIDRRLATWGDKAPYWYFINYGNEGLGAYPHFGGTFFVEKTIVTVSRILAEEMKNAGDKLPRGIIVQIRKAYDQKRKVIENIEAILPVGGVPEGLSIVRTMPSGATQYRDIETGRFARWTRPR